MTESKELKKTPWGYIPSHWKISSIKEETAIVTDYVANGSFASLAENVKYKSEKDYAVLIRLVDYNNQFKGDFVYIDKTAYEFLSKSKLFGDEIIISNVGANVGTVFKCPHLEYKMSLAPNSIMVKFKGNNDFYYYWLQSRFGQHMLQSIVTGSAQPKFNKTNFRDMKIPVPPIDEQKIVGQILKSLDDKIECNKRINDNLENQAQALFKSWFVDFEPFKDGEFVESEMGMIPKEWKLGTLGELCTANKRTYNGKYENIIEYIDTGSVTNNNIESVQRLNPVTDKIPSRARRAVMEGDIIYSSVRPNQRHYAFLYNPPTNMVVSTGFVVLTANWSGYRYYIYQYLVRDEIIDKLQAIAEQSTSTYPSINASDVVNLKIVVPPDGILGEFAEVCHSLIAQIDKNEQESRRLIQLRDTLLPRLMSGELKVNEIGTIK